MSEVKTKLLELDEPSFDERGDSNYWPCDTGLHLCGVAARPGSDYEQPFSALNIEAASETEARAMFNAAKAEAECSKDEGDFICDLMVGGSLIDDFYTNRQLVQRLTEVALAARIDAFGQDAQRLDAKHESRISRPSLT